MKFGEAASMNRLKLLDYIQGRYWATSIDFLESLQRVLLRCENDYVNLATLNAGMGAYDSTTDGLYRIVNGVAIIPIVGSLDKRMSILHWILGGESTEMIMEKISQAVADPKVTSIVLNIDSPGGAIDGIKELSDFIYASRNTKSITAYIDGSALSAGYWIASAAEKIVAPETATIGSIGVYTTHLDVSKFYEDQGVTKTYIYAGKYKVVGHEAGSLKPDDRAYIQGIVDKYYSLFVNDVARNRGVDIKTVLSDMAEGRIFIGDDGLKAGLVDQIGKLEDAVAQGSVVKPGVAAHNVVDIKVNMIMPGLVEHLEKNADAIAQAMMGFTHNSTVADGEPSWGGVDKTKLPRIAHAEMGKETEKSTWKFPHHWVKGGGTLDKRGVYKDGTLYLHKGGLSAAWGAANGARSGKEASGSVKGHLQAHRKALGMEAAWDQDIWLLEIKEVFGDGWLASFKDWYIVRKNNLKKEEKVMTLAELKETYPELVKAISDEATRVFVEKIAGFEAKVKELETSGKAAEKALALTEEKLAFGVAAREMDRILGESSIPGKMHVKVRKQVDFHAYTKDGERFEEKSEGFKAFTKAFEAEVREWEENLSGQDAVGMGVGVSKIDDLPETEKATYIDENKDILASM